jgi:hypothetical protein
MPRSGGTWVGGNSDRVSVVAEAWNYAYISGQATTLVKTGPGILGSLVIPTPVASATIKIWDSLAGSGLTLLDTITLPASPTVLPTVIYLGVAFSVGLTVVTAGATMPITVTYL